MFDRPEIRKWGLDCTESVGFEPRIYIKKGRLRTSGLLTSCDGKTFVFLISYSIFAPK